MGKRVLRTLFFCFAAAFALTLCGLAPMFGARAADIVDSGTCGENGDNLTWTLDSDGVLTISGAGAMRNWMWTWDDELEYAPWYEKRNDIVTVVIDNGVTSIGDKAFEGCTSLTSVTIPDSVTSIRVWAFYDCANLTSVTIPDSVTSIGAGAFWGCRNLTSVTIPDRVTFVGVYAFCDCANLTAILVNSKNQNYMSEKGILFNKNLSALIAYPAGKTGAYELPDSVTSIGTGAFAGCRNLTSVTIGDSVTSIGEGAFDACDSLTDIYYGGSAAQWKEICYWWDSPFSESKNVKVHYDAKDIGLAITLTDENGDTVDANGQTGETEETKKDAFQDDAEFTATFEAVDIDAITSSELVTASVFIIFYDKDGLMVSLEQTEIDLSNPQNLSSIKSRIRVPKGATKLKFLVLGDDIDPLRAVRMIEDAG